MGARPGHGPHRDRGDAARRRRRNPPRPISAFVDGAGAARPPLHSRGYLLSDARDPQVCPRAGEPRLDQYRPLSMVRARLAQRFRLEDIDYQTGGPARYARVKETGGRLGFITLMTHNFCESCNRVRITCTGTLYMCLGQNDAADLRSPLRASEGNDLLDTAIEEAISRKPKGHDFIIDRRHQRPALSRHMSVTGG